MEPSDCPEPWVHNPSDVSVSTWFDIPVQEVWKNTETGEIVVFFETMTTAKDNMAVEVHTNPEMVKSRFRQLKDAFTRGDVETEIPEVTVTGGRRIAKGRIRQEMVDEAFTYMEQN